ncbi:MAG: hypothetical protein CL930_13635 [Deltaproteobacteria bacterium]|nr:hypothetical protein [Deltaproteobacteria bacterium]
MLEKAVLGAELELEMDDQFEITALLGLEFEPDEETEIIPMPRCDTDPGATSTFRTTLMSSFFRNLFRNA